MTDKNGNEKSQEYNGQLSGSMKGLKSGTYMAGLQEQNSENKKKEEEKTFEAIRLQQEIDNWLDSYQKELEQRLKTVERKLSIISEIERLHKNGKFDLSNLEHLTMLQAVDISAEDYEANGDTAITTGKQRATIEKDQILKEQEQVADWKTRRANGDKTVDREILARKNSFEEQRVSHLNLATSGKEESREIAKDLGFDEESLDFLNSGFGEGPKEKLESTSISAADTVSKTPIQAESISPKFTAAASPDQSATPGPDLVVNVKSPTNLTNSL